ncbi:oxidoreductase [Flavobacterium sediminilitoris]|uniref:Oxidoreductase n=1 Tax=Flavobacterium sediminilitoris TaxID=2024526 RepID=A0ABY4HKE8_9FLAO|nr:MULTISPECIES: oxidoreductase [Flavobacterium]UOX33327.1 oxidoreductase [Flavobacterium sediminilitoris]
MRKKLFFFSLLTIVLSCKEQILKQGSKQITFTKIISEEIYNDSISIRAIVLDSNQLWFSGNNGKYGAIDLVTQKKFRGRINKDSLHPEFRSIAKTKDAIFILSVANPALLYKISNDRKVVKLVYQEENEKVFYDSMQFLDTNFGVAMGDPVSNCLNIIITNDGGNTWQKIPCDKLPKVEEGEAAFAASNTNVMLRNNKIIIVSGGKKSRCFVSEDKGNTWQVYNTPIVQGKTMTGIFTADFYDENIGFIAGGDYEKQEDNSNNKAITKDGGKTWQLVGQSQGFGYASCIQFVPNSKGKSLICVGGTGVHYSNDSGNTWKKMLEDKDLYTIRFQNDSIAYAGGKNKIVKLTIEY